MNKYELFGIILGDGCLNYYPKKRVYSLEITGNAEEEVDYYYKISELLFKLTGIKPKIKVKYEKKGKSLKLFLYNKKFVEQIKFKEGFNFKNKANEAILPDKFLKWQYMKHILRGLFETDGCLYFSRINGKPKYPRIEIKTNSDNLAQQLYSILKKQNFRVQKRKDKFSNIVYISGKKELEKWIRKIGFSSLKNKTKYLLWKRLNFYIPHTSLRERIDILQRRAEVPYFKG